MTPSQQIATIETRRRDNVFERAATGLLVADLNGTVTSINAAMEGLIGLAPGRGTGSNLLALLDPPDQICELLEALVDTGGASERVVSLDGGDGVRRIALSAALLPSTSRAGSQEFLATGRSVHAVACPPASLDDATMIAASARVGGLIAHDLNNALGVILGACYLLDTSRHDDVAGRHDLNSLEAASIEAALIVRQLAAHGAARSSAPVPFHPDAELRRLAPILNSLLASAVDIDLPAPPAGGTLLSDPAVFDDVIMSLALEARRTLGPDDRVILQMAPSPAGDEWRLRLRTNRPVGDARDAHTDWSAAGSRSRLSGLGRLAIERWLADQHGWLEINTGTSGFAAEVSWPRLDGRGMHEATESAPETASRARAVLVVDDNVRLRRFMDRVLTADGYQVVAVENGSRAVDAIESQRFDAVVTDIYMPDISGWQVGQAVRQRDPACGVIYVSGESADGEGEEARPADCVLLLKPFTTGRLLETVARACARQTTS